MKKRILASALVLAPSFQATYTMSTLRESSRKMFASLSVREKAKQAKRMFSQKENLRCLRHGDNCTKKKRTFLAWVAVQVSSLAVIATGILGAGLRYEVKAAYKSYEKGFVGLASPF